ncbi:hypothetical protein ACIQUF_24170 [Pseudomonas sp. NPDC090233]|uniref:hypothetical protein n=1 Tax=Pseudomonas sp. NPDC090233 TaxID=3364479 RepID=UPI00383A4FC8
MTDLRVEKGPCGRYPNNPTSETCWGRNPPIYTAQQWVAAYPATPQFNANICAFDVRDERDGHATGAFHHGLLAKRLDSSRFFMAWNELLLSVWTDDTDGLLPIQAFFYNTATALVDARKDRDRFRVKTGIDIPLIKVTLPTAATGDAKFEFIQADQ